MGGAIGQARLVLRKEKPSGLATFNFATLDDWYSSSPLFYLKNGNTKSSTFTLGALRT